MQLRKRSRICCLPRQGSASGSPSPSCGAMTDFRRTLAARAARAWARSSWSSLEPRTKGLVGDWIRGRSTLCFAFGLRISAIEATAPRNSSFSLSLSGLGFGNETEFCPPVRILNFVSGGFSSLNYMPFGIYKK
jgi:hypothetical protein